MKRDTKYFIAFTSLAMIGFLLFYIYPIGKSLWMSFTNNSIGSEIVDFVGLGNYKKAVFNDKLFTHSLKLSFIYAFATGPITLLLSLFAAMLLNTKIKGQGIFRTIFFIPFIVPTFAVVSVFKGFFHPSSGIVNNILALLNINGPGWYLESDSALLTMIIMSCWGFGMKMLIFLAALQNVPRSLYEVADIDGANAKQKFFKVTFPAISSAFFFNVVLTTIDCLKSFNMAFLLGRGTGFPANSTLLFPIYLFNTAFKTPFKLGYASAMAWIFFIIIMVLTIINFVIKKYYVYEGTE